MVCRAVGRITVGGKPRKGGLEEVDQKSGCKGKLEDAHQSRRSGSCDPGEAGRDLSTAPAELAQPRYNPSPNASHLPLSETQTDMAVPPPPPQWVVDLNAPPTAKPKTSSIADPPGYTAPTTVTSSKVRLPASLPSLPTPLIPSSPSHLRILSPRRLLAKLLQPKRWTL